MGREEDRRRIQARGQGKGDDVGMLRAMAACAAAGVIVLALLSCDKDKPTRTDGGPEEVDSIPPATVADLSAVAAPRGAILLTWTAPGDDGAEGPCSGYDVRHSTTEPGNPDWWWETQDLAQLANPPVPSSAGSIESLRVWGLEPESPHYFALKAVDEASNWSDLSNIATATIEPEGPHAFGVLLTHLNPALEYTSSSTSYAGQSDLDDCAGAITQGRVLPDTAQVWFVIASLENSPGPVDLGGVEFGFGDFDSSRVSFVGWGACPGGSLEISTASWPGPGAGTALVFGSCHYEMVELYWFACYVYAPLSIPLGPNPATGSASFLAGESYLTDEVADFGVLGFGEPGYSPCACRRTPSSRHPPR